MDIFITGMEKDLNLKYYTQQYLRAKYCIFRHASTLAAIYDPEEIKKARNTLRFH